MIYKTDYSLVPQSFILCQKKSMPKWDWYLCCQKIPRTDISIWFPNSTHSLESRSVIAIQRHQQNTFIRNLYTDPDFRKMGYGSNLIRYVQKRYDCLQLDCKPYLVEFYKRLDFDVIKERKIGKQQYIRMAYFK